MEDFLNLGGVPVRNLPILKFNPYNESANDDEAGAVTVTVSLNGVDYDATRKAAPETSDDEAVDAKLSARSVTFEDIRPALNTFSPPPK